ncbi:hypothetical protein PED39_03380 [Methanomassiliicoccales archaeon LGM-RCC1]|nr:hypothetical protein PED39_03380 [Methanomassiliicoccales archaeon LGM-RCC1]
MNTKTTKFLAVLAVFAMAFAVFAAIAPAQDDDASVIDSLDGFSSSSAVDQVKSFYVDGTASTSITNTTEFGAAINLYVYPGTAGITLNVDTGAANNMIIHVMTAAATYDSTTQKWSGGAYDDSLIKYQCADSSGSKAFKINSDGSITSTVAINANGVYGMIFYDYSDTSYTYYAKGADAGTITLDTNTDEFTVFNGSAIVQNKESSNIVSKITFKGYVGASSTNDVTKVTRTSATVTTLTMPKFDSNADLTAGSMTINSGVFTVYASTGAHGSEIKTQTAFDYNFVASGKADGWYYASDALSTLIEQGTPLISSTYCVLAVMGTPVVAEDSITLADDTQQYDLYLKKATMTSLTVKVGTTVEHKIGAANLTAKIWMLEEATSVVDSIDGPSGSGAKKALIGTLTLKSGTFNVPTDGLIVGYYDSPTQNIGRLNVGEGAELSLDPTTVNSRTTQGTVKISKGSEIAVFGSITSTADRTINPAVASTNDGTFSAYGNAIIGQKVYITVSNFNIENASKTIDISHDIVSDIVFKQYQTVNIVGNVNILPGVAVNVLGTLNITPGSTLTVMKNSTLTLGSVPGLITSKIMQLDNQGTMDIAGTFIVAENSGAADKVVSSGTIEVDGTFTADAAIELTAGKMNVGTTGVLGGTGLIVGSDAVLTIDGSVSGTIGIAGKLKIDGSVTAALVLNMKANAAEINLSEVKFTNNSDAGTNGNRTITVTDDGLKLAKGRVIGEGSDPKGESMTVVANAQNDIIYGLVITESISSWTYNSVKYFSAAIVLSGATSADLASAAGTDVAITLNAAHTDGAYFATGEIFSIGKDVSFATSEGTTITVTDGTSMYWTSSDAGTITNNGAITAVGTLFAKSAITGTINATLYTMDTLGTKTYIYTTLASAIDSGATKLTISGTNKVLSNLDIPADVTIDAAAGATLIIGSTDDRSVTATLKDGAVLKNASVDVKGTFIVENKLTGLKNTSVTSDVSSTNGNVMKYTNVYYALLGAQEGEVIKITTSETVVIDMNTTIPAGVTLEVPASGTLAVQVGKILTVDGILDSWYAVKAVYTDETTATFGLVENDDNAKIVVNGIFVSTDAITYANYKVPGAYFETTTTSPYYAVAAPEVAALMIATIDDEAITLHGELSLGTIAFVGIEGAVITLASDAQITASKVLITDARVVSSSADNATSYFKGTIEGTAGAVKITDMVGFTVIDNTDDEKTYLADNSTIKASTVTGHASNNAISISSGTVYASGAVDAAKLTVSSGAEFIVSKSANSFEASTSMSVAGIVTVTNGGAVTVPSLFVTGSFIVLPADAISGIAAGSATVTTAAYVGFTKASEVYVAPTTSGSAVLSAETLGTGLSVVYALAGSTVSEDLISAMTKSTFVVEGSDYLYVYVSTSAADMYAYGIQAPELDNADFKNWTYVSSGETKYVTSTSGEKLSTARTYTAYIDYNLYKVEVYTDAGIKAVSIDGVEMLNEKNNMFITINNLKAGNHTIAFTLKDGYQEDANGVHLYTADGTLLQSLKFTVSGDAGTTKLLLNGTEQIIAPEPTPVEQNEWTITTILLVILVILIAVMAVIVALRLNRS